MNQNRNETAKFTTTVNGEKKSKVINLYETTRSLIEYVDYSNYMPESVMRGLIGLKKNGLNINDIKNNNFFMITNIKKTSMPVIRDDEEEDGVIYTQVPRCIYIFINLDLFKKRFKDYIYKIIDRVVLNLADDTADYYITTFKQCVFINPDGQYMMAEGIASIFMDIISEFQ